MDYKQFEKARDKILNTERQSQGIGTLSEKTVHAILKFYYEPNDDYHEVSIEHMVADIFRDGKIVEIQTRSFDKMRKKLDVFLKDYFVTIVHPIIVKKELIYIDKITGEIIRKRKSPKNETIYHAFLELYKIKSFLKHNHLKFIFVLMEVEEYRLVMNKEQKKRKKSTKLDRIPLAIKEEVTIEDIKDFMQCVPYTLEESFTSSDFAKEAKIPKKLATTVLHILNHMNIVKRVGKLGNSYIYQVVE
ncbi:MAG: hypothetical protein ACRC7V_08690 [Lachnospiraceae bacterium]